MGKYRGWDEMALASELLSRFAFYVHSWVIAAAAGSDRSIRGPDEMSAKNRKTHQIVDGTTFQE